ncbi:PepSY domain-containing protein [Streptomyces sp. NBC_00249]|uniref:PepSY domain-containing protein n=1 Tax=Streptomyces sp. NBC_00249 TaxID=2975690 RepID=UPI0022567408|nr:PepSY domain-containing protein [Streptomyces sp. NBC_00249]MCX5194322.1 PepSY domain-containing protein [Streptomyces sp. NBC_00249]
MKRTRTCTLYVPAAVAAALLFPGPAAAVAATSADAAGSVPASAVARADTDAAGAAAAALKKYPGYVESLDKDGSVWHVNVIAKGGQGHAEVEVDSAGAATVRNRDSDNEANEYKTLLAAKISADRAMKAALAAHPGKVWSVDWDDENDNGVADHWSVQVRSSNGDKKNVAVDATSGKVTASRSDSNDNDNDSDSDGNDDGN